MKRRSEPFRAELRDLDSVITEMIHGPSTISSAPDSDGVRDCVNFFDNPELVADSSEETRTIA
jgi:hypothetical protein